MNADIPIPTSLEPAIPEAKNVTLSYEIRASFSQWMYYPQRFRVVRQLQAMTALIT